jgi:hypothetical protein
MNTSYLLYAAQFAWVWLYVVLFSRYCVTAGEHYSVMQVNSSEELHSKQAKTTTGNEIVWLQPGAVSAEACYRVGEALFELSKQMYGRTYNITDAGPLVRWAPPLGKQKVTGCFMGSTSTGWKETPSGGTVFTGLDGICQLCLLSPLRGDMRVWSVELAPSVSVHVPRGWWTQMNASEGWAVVTSL